MTRRRYGIVCLMLGLALGVVTLSRWLISANAAMQQNDKPVEQVQKNIQVLAGMPSSQLLPVMHFMRASLGVRCDYCHVAENGKYWIDDKPAKQTARRMLRMVFEINKENFGGQPVVTCNTCHRGSTKPVSVPAIGQGSFTNTTASDDVATAPERLPTADQVFQRYVQAMGGKASVDGLRRDGCKQHFSDRNSLTRAPREQRSSIEPRVGPSRAFKKRRTSTWRSSPRLKA